MNIPIDKTRFVLVLAVVAAAVGCGWMVSQFTKNTAPENPVDAAHEAARQRKESNITGWRAVPQLNLVDMDQSQILNTLHENFDPWLSELNGTRIDALLNTLAGHILARVEPSPAKYVSFAEDDPTTLWTTRQNERDWGLITKWYEYHTGAPVIDSVTVQDMLDANITLQTGKNGGGLVGIGVGPTASWGMVFQARSADELLFRISQNITEEESSYWFENSGQVGLPFQVPIISIADSIQASGKVTVAAICLIVETEGGSRWNLHSRWFWDVQLKQWICDVYSKKSHDKKAYIWF